MRKLGFMFVLVVLICGACDWGKIDQAVQTAKTAGAIANGAEMGLFGALSILHGTGNLSDARWAQITAIDVRFKASYAAFLKAVAEWDATKGKPIGEVIQQLVLDLNGIIAEINALIAAWGTPVAQIPRIPDRV